MQRTGNSSSRSLNEEIRKLQNVGSCNLCGQLFSCSRCANHSFLLRAKFKMASSTRRKLRSSSSDRFVAHFREH